MSWVCQNFLLEHEWVIEPNVLWKENDILDALNYDIDVQCPLQMVTSVLRTVKAQQKNGE